jgi:hypothetical protein
MRNDSRGPASSSTINRVGLFFLPAGAAVVGAAGVAGVVVNAS